MNNRTAFMLICALAVASVSYGQAWVSASIGSDSNTCTRTSPCRTFQHAHDVTAAFGQVNVVDPGDYGKLIINKAITIDGGGLASNVIFSGNGIYVDAGPSDVVQIRNLSLHGNGGFTGIFLNTGGQFHLENVKVNGFNGNCIQADIVGPASANSDLAIKDSSIENCSTVGIFLYGNPVNLTVEITNTQVHFANYGLYVDTALVTVSGSSFSSPVAVTAYGIFLAHGNTPAQQQVEMDNCNLSGYNTAIYSGSGTVQVNRSTLSHNTLGLQTVSTGVIVSNGTNSFLNNGSNGVFTKTVSLF